MSPSARARFDGFEFDPATGDLRRDGAAVNLQPQPARVLMALIERAGDVVTREELRSAIWGDATFVDFDRGLNFCIAQIRSALGDSPESPTFIRTLPKRGYQFIAPVEWEPSAGDRSVPEWGQEGVRNVPDPGLRGALLAVTVFAFALAAALWVVVHGLPFMRPHRTLVAIARFDNETAAPELDRFADALTDSVVAQLTASGQGRYEVIGNAAILRRPRSERDLRAIGSSLGVTYVVIGQVQRSGTHIRVLAHLIRLPEQTHIWVTRLDRSLDDPLAAQLEIAQTIASDFSRRLSPESRTPLPPSSSVTN
jgi:DNA-binding winged helix-turn-helix (wHTH) protein/TolB-like protein